MVGVHPLDARQGTLSLKSGTVSSMPLGVTLKPNSLLNVIARFLTRRCCPIGIGQHRFVFR
jgi:hypothetical protein